MPSSLLAPFTQCLNTNRNGVKSVAYMKSKTPSLLPTQFHHQRNENEWTDNSAKSESNEESVVLPDDGKNIETELNFGDDCGLRIVMTEPNEDEMTYHIEVEGENHNSRFYELHNKDIATLANIFTAHPRVKNVELVASSLESNGKSVSKNSWKSRDLKLNATHLQRLKNLNTLCIRLNGLLELSMSAPFYFPIQQLCLTDVNIKLYDFGLLIRCVGHSLNHLCLERIKIVDSAESNDILIQLQRVRSLQSLRIDFGLSEAYPSLSEILINKAAMSAIYVSSVSLDFFLNTNSFDLASTIFAQKLTYKHNSYGPDDIQSLEQVLEERRRRSKPVCKIRLVVGLPSSWLTRVDQCNLESVFKLGNLDICRLEESPLEEESRQLNKTLFKLQI